MRGHKRISFLFSPCPYHKPTKVMISLLQCTGSHVLGGCVLLMLGFHCTYYVCQDILTLASGCLSRATSVQALVVMLWSQLMCVAWQSWWASTESDTERTAVAATQLRMRMRILTRPKIHKRILATKFQTKSCELSVAKEFTSECEWLCE